MPTALPTSSSTKALATAYGNQRKIDRCQNGVLWAVHVRDEGDRQRFYFHYSTDNGATWAAGGGTSYIDAFGVKNAEPNSSLFIDQDDYAHFVYKNSNNRYVEYRRGTPNAARTAWTWSAAHQISGDVRDDTPDLVAHPNESVGQKVHVVYGRSTSGASVAWYRRLSITTAGAVTYDISSVQLGGLGAGNTHPYPSIDFHHTGDGKTVKDGTPHVYIGWSNGAAGSGYGIRFKKGTHSAGSWTWSIEREIDSTRFLDSTTAGQFWLNCIFDGTRAVLVGVVKDSLSRPDLIAHERDAADTITTARVLLDDHPGGAGGGYGAASYDGDGNLYIFGQESSTSLAYRKWTRSVASLGAPVTVDASPSATPYVSAKRGYSNNRIEYIYMDGTSSYTVMYDGIQLNRAPNTPTINAPAGAIGTVTPLLSATASDPDSNNVRCYFQVSTTSNFSNVVFQGWGTMVASGTASTLRTSQLSSSTTYYVRALAEDSAGLQSSYSAGTTFTTPAPLTSTFTYTGGVQTFVVPAGVTSLTVDAYGGSGGNANYPGGAAGRTQGTITVTPGEVLDIIVAGAGGNSTTTTRGAAGYGGGGIGGYDYQGGGGGGGGGCSRIMRSTTPLLVAAGGGGGSQFTSSGGAGGGTTGVDGGYSSTDNLPGLGGTQSAGGAVGGGTSARGSATAGSSLTGGGADYASQGNGGAGGGAGYFGGGAGYGGYNAPGAGGGSALVPAGGSTTAGARTGNGTITLTYAQFSETANQAPTAPTLGVPANNHKQRGVVTAAWTHNDPDGHAQGGYAFRRTRNGVNSWWNGSAWVSTETFVNVATQGVAFPSGAWGAGTYTWTVRTTDALGTPGPYATARNLTILSGMAMIV